MNYLTIVMFALTNAFKVLKKIIALPTEIASLE